MGWITVDVEDEQGRRGEALVPSEEPPRIGDWFDDEGRRVRRLPTRVAARVKSVNQVVGYSLPRLKDVRKYGYAKAPRYNDRGFPVFDSQREVTEFISRNNDNPVNGGQLAWDPDGNE